METNPILASLIAKTNTIEQKNIELAKETDELPLTIKEKLAKLRQALEEKNPAYSTALAELYKATRDNQQYVYLLSEEEMNTIFRGMETFQVMTIDIPKGLTKKGGAKLTEDSV